ncbi:MAG: hypothetical protein V5A24_07990, partial [Haloarculaceae archaeon]
SIGGLLGLEGLIAVLAATGIGVVVGIVLTYVVLSMAIAVLSFIAGAFAGLVVLEAIAPGLSPVLLYPGALVVGFVAATLSGFLSRTILVLVSSFVGATLVSGSITPSNVETAAAEFTLDPILFDLYSPIFLGLFVLGILTQFGIFRFGYVTTIVSVLPGASVLRDRGRKNDTADSQEHSGRSR